MSLADFLNGAGPFVAVSALPMLAGLLLRREALAAPLRRLAIILALALPALFMLLTLFVYIPAASRAPFDFEVNYQAARALYAQGVNPYSVQAAYSFPFPTFYLYWIGSGFGARGEAAAWVVWWLINGLIWLLCVVGLWRMLPRLATGSGTARQRAVLRDSLRYAAVAIPATTVLWQGQTALFILAGLVLLHAALRVDSSRWMFLPGGIGLAFATLVKPQLALVGVGIVIWSVAAIRAQRFWQRGTAQRVVWTVASAVVGAVVLVGLTLLLPGGVTLDTYRHFISDALPQVARPADSILVIGSPAFTAAVLALRFGATDSTADLVANVVTVIILAFAALWTLRRVNRPLVEIAAGWGVWAMVAPRVTWSWYAAWCLPFFALAILESGPRRLALIVLALGLLNLQFNVPLLPLLTILLLIGLLWTSFEPGIAPTPSQVAAHV